MATCLQFAMSNPTPGLEDEFNRWYATDHIDHVIQLPAILGGQRFKRVDGPWPSGKHDYVAIWEMDDPKRALEELAGARGGDDMPISPAIDMSTVQPPTMWLRASVRNCGRIVTDSHSRKTVVLILVNALEGQSEAFEKAMVSETLAKLADLPGVLAADFLTLAEEQIRGNARKFNYGILIELADDATGLAALKDPLSRLPHANLEKWLGVVFRPLDKRLTKADLEKAAS